MASIEWMEPGVNSIMWQLRMEDKEREDKERENEGKPPLNSPDVMMTGDYVFTPITPLDRIGDSGQLLLAKKKSDRSQRYLVKHEFTDCAANEFVYTKLAQAMRFKMPDAFLFQFSKGEKRRYFKTEYILGTTFLDFVVESPTYEQIREQAANWQDFFHFQAMYTMCREQDSFEVPIASDGCLYRVDTTASFILSDNMLAQAGINEVIGNSVPKENIKKCYQLKNWHRKSRNQQYSKTIPLTNLKKTTARLSPVLHFADYRIKRKFFLWIKVILSEHDLLIPLKFQRLPGNLAL